MDSHHHSTPNQGYHPDEWVIKIKKSLEEEEDDDDSDYKFLISITSIPKSLKSVAPESYIPQLVAIGPYHHFRAELNHMAGSKLSGVETLSWMMAIDACFLLEFLRVYVFDDAKAPQGISPFISRRKSTHNSVLRDILMLENQMPLFLLGKVLDFGCTSTEEADDLLSTMLKSFIIAISPLKITTESFPQSSDARKSSHLLEVLYNFLVPEKTQLSETAEIEEEDDSNSLSNQARDFLNHVKQVIISWPIKLLLKVSFRMLSNLPGFLILRQSFEYFSESETTTRPTDFSINMPPVTEEIKIPSATELVSAGIHFLPTNRPLSEILFDTKTGTLHLPIISVDVNTEVMLRNLVAYETAVASEPLVFTCYIELMNGLSTRRRM